MELKIYSIYEKKLFGYTVNELGLILAVLSIFIPNHIFTTVVLSIFSSGIFLTLFTRPGREKIMGVAAFKYAAAAFPIFIFPPLIHQNWLGLTLGFLYWYGMLFTCDLFATVTVDFYNKLIDIILVMSIFSFICVTIQAFFLNINRPSSFFINANYYAAATEVFIFTSLYRFSCSKKMRYLSATLINLLGLYLSNCRTAWIALILAALFYIILYIKKKRVLFAMLILSALFLSVIFIFMPRMDVNSLSAGADKRLDIWLSAWTYFQKEPIMGHGMYYMLSLNDILGFKFVPHAHNLVFEVLLAFGIVGLCFFSLVMGKYYRKIIEITCYGEQYRKISRLIIILTICFIVHGLTDFIISAFNMYILVFTVLSGGFTERNERINKRLPCHIQPKNRKRWPVSSHSV